MNMQAMLAQAQRMQKDIQNKQKQIYDTEYTGESQMVTVVMMGNKKVKSIKLKVNQVENDDIEILEDMIKIAFDDAINKIDKDVDTKLGSYGKQLGGLI
ncbi:MAG TPA: YbaB/EbfC family nucleoid-associated protein [Bacilli bacterium]|jgi:DNA-binding YbaB/EbfC family protein|nr:YbaB/EbfC family nucleoid-associated protein [Bacilli bacterium]HQC83259.1 YbaB/EbfC family nucleoid-associated protein [Bacilli bacterium]